MLERCFKQATVDRLRNGPAGPFLDGFAEALFAEGYAPKTSGSYLHAADHLCRWISQRGRAVEKLDEAQLRSFVRHLPKCRCPDRKRHARKRVPYKVHRFLYYLRDAGVVTTCAPIATREPLVTEYVAWMRGGRGLAPTTIGHSVPVVEALLLTVADDPARLDASGVRRFVLKYIREHAPASAGCVTTIVRCFLRWLVMHGRCLTDLTEAVPKVPTWRLARLPRYLPDDDIERIIVACDRPSLVARRDRAMLLLLARLGLRGGDVVGLRLDDIDWVSNQILFRALKHGKDSLLPLTREVGESLLDYLQNARPDCQDLHLFVSLRAPYHGLKNSSVLSNRIDHYIRAAGIEIACKGAHVFRHGFATRMLAQGHSLKAIADVLGHRHLESTFIYTKVDFEHLKQVALPWPGETSP